MGSICYKLAGIYIYYSKAIIPLKLAKLISKKRKENGDKETFKQLQTKYIYRYPNKKFIYAKCALMYCFFTAMIFFVMFALININK